MLTFLERVGYWSRVIGLPLSLLAIIGLFAVAFFIRRENRKDDRPCGKK